MPVITAAALRRFAPRADERIAAAFVAHAAPAFARWGLTTGPRLRMFMAQVAVESAGLTVLFEDMSYTAARIHAVWPSRFPSVAAAQPYAHNARRLADKVYGGRLGNRAGTDDGWLCRGQGLLDDTGRTTFAHLAAHMQISVDDARACLTSDEGMVEAAAATFHMLGCLPYADRGDLVGCTKRVNGGLIGLADRRAALARATRLWTKVPALPADVPLAHALPVPTAPPAAPKPALRAPKPASNETRGGWLPASLRARRGLKSDHPNPRTIR